MNTQEVMKKLVDMGYAHIHTADSKTIVVISFDTYYKDKTRMGFIYYDGQVDICYPETNTLWRQFNLTEDRIDLAKGTITTQYSNEVLNLIKEEKNMKKYIVKKNIVEVLARDKVTISSGIGLSYKDDVYLEDIDNAVFDSNEEAIKYIKENGLKPSVNYYGNYYQITEYIIIEVELNDDGDDVAWGDMDTVYNYHIDENDSMVIDSEK